jgi:hypothetical protein
VTYGDDGFGVKKDQLIFSVTYERANTIISDSGDMVRAGEDPTAGRAEKLKVHDHADGLTGRPIHSPSSKNEKNPT